MDTANNATPAENVQELKLPALPQAVREARHRVHSLLRDWASPVDWDTAILLLSEVLTNAILHGTNPETLKSTEIRLIVRQGPDGLCIEVYDHGDGEPTPVRTDQDWAAESGRGLDLVELLADEWGTKREGESKSVYFVLAADPATTYRDTTRSDESSVITSQGGVEKAVLAPTMAKGGLTARQPRLPLGAQNGEQRAESAGAEATERNGVGSASVLPSLGTAGR